MLRIRVVGRECKICGKILAVVQRAVDILGIDASIRKVTVPAEIEGYHLDAVPGLVINDRVVCEGRIPTEGEIHYRLASPDLRRLWQNESDWKEVSNVDPRL